jgi:general secretion pathway protein D
MKLRFFSRLVLSFFLTLVLFSSSLVSAKEEVKVTVLSEHKTPTTEVKESKTRLWNLQDADILSVINEVSQETGKNFVVDPRVNGKITLISSKPLRQNEVYQVFLSVLSMLGFSAIPSGDIIKIVPNMESGEQSTPVLSKGAATKGDEVVVRIIPLENVSSTQLIPILRPLLPQWSNISAYTPSNVLIVLGRASNIDRIMAVINDVDRAANNGIEMIPLKYAQASQVATVLNNLQAAGRAAGEAPGATIGVDERSNSLLLSGLKKSRIRMRVLISQLDAPSKSSSGNTEVVYLRYLQAKTFAPLLGKIAQNILGKGSSSNENVPAVSTPSASSATSSASTSKESSVNSTNIQAEPNTNALIITAPPTLMQALKSVIAKLDIRPAQVAIEGIIAEVDESNVNNLGIQWGSLVTTSFGTTSSSSSSSSSSATAAATQGVLGILPGIHNIQAVLTMLQTLQGVDILSTPSIMVLDNQAATIEIGQAVPVTTGSYTTPTGGQSPSGSPTPFTTTDYRNVTLKLDVTPQINLGNAVRMKLALKNDVVAGPAATAGGNPPINTSSIKNSVLVNHEDVLVLGGLIQTSTNETITRVPILGDIPVVGKLFQQKNLTQQKKNLMVFIKPSIVHNSDETMAISYSKYSETRRAQANHKEVLENLETNISVHKMLPAWKNPTDLPKPFSADSR